jgi:polyisoprenoid-binding protein YceI
MKLRHASVTLAAVVLAAVATPLIADAKLAGASGMESHFTAVGPAGMKIVGTTKDGRVEDDGTAMRVTVPLANLTTGISLRDKHMREKYLQVGSYPDAQLEVARAAIVVPKQGAESSGDVPGVLRLHGQNKSVTVHYSAKRDGDTLHVNGALHVNMNDFGIEVPKYLGITVKPEVDVDVRFDTVDH